MPERKAGVTDYSKWDNIELSDDESDVHPNIEKGTWFRLKHKQRVEREEAEAKERAELEETIKTAKETLETGEGDKAALEAAIEKAEARIAKMEKNKKWNVDNICKTTEERTLINHESEAGKHEGGYVMPETDKDRSFVKDGFLSEDEKIPDYQVFCETHKDLLAKFMACVTMEETHKLLKDNVNILLQEHSSWYLLLNCLEAEMEGDRKKMKLRARQSQVISSITELAKTEKRHPGNIIEPFFEKLKDPKRFSVFVEGVDAFANNIIKRAEDKKKEQALGLSPGQDVFTPGVIVEAKGLKGIPELNGKRGEVKCKVQKTGRIGVVFPEPFGEKALKPENLDVVPVEQLQAEQEALAKADTDPDKCWWLPYDLPRAERLGPGGLDPCEVFSELPKCLQDAFRSREMEPLYAAIDELGPDEARKWLKKCNACGLWNSGDSLESDEEEEEKKEEAPAAKPAKKKPAPAL
eukprot:TRINITY_DN273_c2_g3_i1.p1 TRINITY_DN273_c2_g3~~TRINITY_DN273_c2_g3_i1.p1  ORF type:complete len:487 (+),score=291.31 TRINITY_DN273_c2_g3_i1:62-1462(+)